MSDDYAEDSLPPGHYETLPEVRRPGGMIFASPECAAVFGALAEAQGAIENPKRTRKAKVQGQTKAGARYEYEYMYAPLDEIHDVIREPLAKAALGRTQFLAQRAGQWVMRTIIYHSSGQWIGCDYPIFPGRQEGAQGFASGVTYARRYGLMLALGIAAEDDDDANVADGIEAKVSDPPRRGRQPKSPSTREEDGKRPEEASRPPAAEDPAETAARHRIRMLIASFDNHIRTAPSLQALNLCFEDGRDELAEIEAAGDAGKAALQQLRDRYMARVEKFK